MGKTPTRKVSIKSSLDSAWFNKEVRRLYDPLIVSIMDKQGGKKKEEDMLILWSTIGSKVLAGLIFYSLTAKKSDLDKMEPNDVVDMINDQFSVAMALVEQQVGTAISAAFAEATGEKGRAFVCEIDEEIGMPEKGTLLN